MEYKALTEEEKINLKALHKKERDKRICDRIKAVLLYDDGYTLDKIAKILLLSDEGVRQHIKDYHKQNKLHTENGGGISKLKKEQEQELVEHLDVNNYIYARDILNHIEKRYGVKYSVFGVTKLLHRLGFSYKKPKLIPGKLDLAKQEEFKERYSLLKSNLKEDQAIYFIDSVHPQYQTKARCGWIRNNVTKTLPSFSGWKRKHITGAINLKDLDVITLEHNKVNSDSVIEFLKKIEERNFKKDKIYLICDNAGYHKSQKIKEYLKNSRIELVYLPPYSPNLNPIERLWKFMHSVVTNNRFYDSFESFTKAINSFFEKISDYKNKLTSLITDNFQQITVNHFINCSG